MNTSFAFASRSRDYFCPRIDDFKDLKTILNLCSPCAYFVTELWFFSGSKEKKNYHVTESIRLFFRAEQTWLFQICLNIIKFEWSDRLLHSLYSYFTLLFITFFPKKINYHNIIRRFLFLRNWITSCTRTIALSGNILSGRNVFESSTRVRKEKEIYYNHYFRYF